MQYYKISNFKYIFLYFVSSIILFHSLIVQNQISSNERNILIGTIIFLIISNVLLLIVRMKNINNQNILIKIIFILYNLLIIIFVTNYLLDFLYGYFYKLTPPLVFIILSILTAVYLSKSKRGVFHLSIIMLPLVILLYLYILIKIYEDPDLSLIKPIIYSNNLLYKSIFILIIPFDILNYKLIKTNEIKSSRIENIIFILSIVYIIIILFYTIYTYIPENIIDNRLSGYLIATSYVSDSFIELFTIIFIIIIVLSAIFKNAISFKIINKLTKVNNIVVIIICILLSYLVNLFSEYIISNIFIINVIFLLLGTLIFIAYLLSSKRVGSYNE